MENKQKIKTNKHKIQLTHSSLAANATQTPSTLTRAFPPMHSAVEVRMRDHHPFQLPPPISINLQICSPCQVLRVKVQSQPLPLLHLVETRIFLLRIFRTRSGEISCRLLLPLPDNSPHLLLVTTHLFKQMGTHSYLPVNKLLQLIIINKRPPRTKMATTFSLHSLLLLHWVRMMELISII